MKKPLLKNLNLWDIAVLTLVLFGQAIYASTRIFLTSQGQGNPELTETSSAQNFQLLLFQGALLILALGYLYFRRFDFRQALLCERPIHTNCHRPLYWTLSPNGRFILSL